MKQSIHQDTDLLARQIDRLMRCHGHRVGSLVIHKVGVDPSVWQVTLPGADLIHLADDEMRGFLLALLLEGRTFVSRSRLHIVSPTSGPEVLSPDDDNQLG